MAQFGLAGASLEPAGPLRPGAPEVFLVAAETAVYIRSARMVTMLSLSAWTESIVLPPRSITKCQLLVIFVFVTFFMEVPVQSEFAV